MNPKDYSQMMAYLTRPAMARGGRIGFRNRGSVITEDMQKKSAEAIKVKATNKLKNFVEKFKLENDGELPTQQQIMKAVGGKSSSIQKYLEEGVDFKKRITKQEAGRLAGLKSGEVRAVPEGQDPSYVKRNKTLDEASKFLSKQDDADFKKINAGKKAINKYFKNKPELINTTKFGKNIKQLLALRMDKDTGNIFSKVRPDSYYENLARRGKLFDIFDIKAVKEGGRSLRFPTNINIAPSQFNQVFIQNQVGKFFAKGINEEAVKNVENLLKERNIRVKLPNVGYLGQDNPVAVDRTKGTFPKITDTLKKMDAPKEILDLFETKDLNKPLSELAANIDPEGCGRKTGATGGRVGLKFGSTECAAKAKKRLDQIILRGTKNKSEQVLANQILKIGRSLKDITSIRGTLGPAALAFTAATEAGLVGYDMLAEGKTFREAVGDSVFNYALGPKTKIDSVQERNKRFRKLGVSEEDMGKIGAYESALQGIEQFDKTFEEAQTAQQRLDEANMAIDPTLFPGTINELQKNLNTARANVQDLYRAGDPYQRLAPAIEPTGLAALQEAQKLTTVDKLTSAGPKFFGKVFPKYEESRQQRILDASAVENPGAKLLRDLGLFGSGFAGGGIAKEAGDPSGAMLESMNPDSQGLPGLLKRGMKI